MAIAVGSRIGVYEVVGLLGEGGMGSVYRAHDAKLNRDVAIKVLLPEVANDADRLARFRREAQTLAALNHPHIAHIHGLEESDGVQALVMELVEGEDLAARIARPSTLAQGVPSAVEGRGGIPVDEALAIAQQIADALEAAHQQGIIHRDLKPANIKVRADGTVKVLDFGLAKAVEGAGTAGGAGMAGRRSASMSPTITSPALMTGVGIILGTAAYMAPEQARGRVVDRRADIWAFGCVLFEMLTGRRVFEGDDMTVTLARVVEREPDFSALPAGVPSAVRQALKLCLQKDPRQRMRDIGDVRLALDGAFETIAPQPPTPSASTSRGRQVWIGAFAASSVLAGALAIPAWQHVREAPPPEPLETRLEIVTPATGEFVTATGNGSGSFALSPDGRQIVFVAAGDGAQRLWIRRLATTTAQPLAGTEGAVAPFWSPDGRSIGFFAASALKRIDLAGGTPRTLAAVAAGQGGTWNAEGVVVFAPSTTTGLMRVAASGGQAVPVGVSVPQQQGQVRPAFLPDGRHLLFAVTGAPGTSGIYLGALDGGVPTRLTDNFGDYTLLPSGWLISVRPGGLVAQELDLGKAALVGDPVTIADGATSVASANTGVIAYRAALDTLSELRWVDRSGAAKGTVGDADASLTNPRVSPDGRRVVVSRTMGGNEDLWLLDGVRTSRFTFDPANDRFPVWSPDGTRVVFYSTRSGGGDLFSKPAGGGGEEERLPAPDRFKLATSWSADGRFLLFQQTDPKTSSDIWVQPMTGGAAASVFLKTPATERFGAFSPDGRWVAYQSNESGRNEIYVRAFAPPGSTGMTAAAGQWQVSTTGGFMPTWRHDGRELYYLDPAGTMMAASITLSGTTLEPGAPVVLFPTQVVGSGLDNQQGRQYDVTIDGRFLINTLVGGTVPPITVLQNWQPPSH